MTPREDGGDMRAKACSRCGIEKPVLAFGRKRTCSDGLQSRCKKCKAAEDRAWRRHHPEVQRRANKRYRDADPERYRIKRNQWRQANPEKSRAHATLSKAVKMKRITKPSVCSDCGATGVRITGHHHDYNKRLDVEWLCNQCHFGGRHAHAVRAV